MDRLQDAGSTSHHRRQKEGRKVVMVVGRPGAGKSNLANKLLHHPTFDAFEEGDKSFGAESETQRGEWDGVVVIDTPGIPSHDPQTTLTNFDTVVNALRREGSLSTLIFLVQQEDTSPAEFDVYSILLKQLNQLPCSKLIVCRQAVVSRRHHRRTEEDRRHSSAQFVEHVLQDTGLSMPLVLLDDGYGSKAFEQVAEIRRFIRQSELAPVNPSSLRTSAELRLFVRRLADPTSRLDALVEEVEELELSLWHRSLWMSCQVVPLAYNSVCSPGAGCLWTGPYVMRELEAFGIIRMKLNRKKEEIKLKAIDEVELQAAQRTLAYLDQMWS